MTSNTQTNNLIRWIVIATDFVVLNVLLVGMVKMTPVLDGWSKVGVKIFILLCNFAMALSETRFSTIIHERLVTAGDILRRVVMLVVTETLLSYLLMKALDMRLPVGRKLLLIGMVLLVLLILSRVVERWMVKHYRMAGRNTRYVTLVGNDAELEHVRQKLEHDPTLGYRVVGEFKNAEDFLRQVESMEDVQIGDELYLCVSRREKDVVRKISGLCDQHVVRFFYVPVSVESMGISLKREMMDDIEIYTTYDIPLANPVNKLTKRLFDIVFSLVFLLPTAIIFPIVFVIVKIQSPGPILFRQKRTGLDGSSFNMLKFRSMHVNDDADKVQATKDDPRKYPFGNFMRKTNIDELPQFWNVLRGDMSIVGPRPHMLAHTEQYSELISRYMVRHFVKPGVTGWAQVTGFRGETKELWQMEGRVKHDIWYIENWSVWLDIRIIWMTLKTIFIHDKNAY